MDASFGRGIASSVGCVGVGVCVNASVGDGNKVGMNPGMRANKGVIIGISSCIVANVDGGEASNEQVELR